MGSSSDLKVMKDAADVLKELGIEFEMTVVSAHRTPELMFSYAKGAADRGLILEFMQGTQLYIVAAFLIFNIEHITLF